MLQRFLLGFAVFFVSWHLLRPGGLNVTFSDLAFIALLGLLVMRGGLITRFFGVWTPVWLTSLVLMLGGLLIGTLANGIPSRWVVVSGQFTFAFLALPLILASLSRNRLDACLVVFVLGITASQAIAVTASLFYDFQDTSPYLGYNFITGTGRVGAFSGNANTNGAMCGFALVALIEVFDRRLLAKWASAICAVFLVWGLIASASFGAFIICSVALLLSLAIRWPKPSYILALPTILLPATYLYMGFPLPELFEARVANAIENTDLSQAGTFLGRLDLAAEAWSMASDNLLVGLGADGFREASIYGKPVHIFPLLMLVEAGIVGFVGLLGLLVVMCVQAFASLAHDWRRGSMAIGTLLMFAGFTMTVPHMYARMWLFPVMLALIYARSGPACLPRARGLIRSGKAPDGQPVGDAFD